MTSTLMAVQFDAPLANPAPNGLFGAVNWQTDADGQPRWLAGGVDITPFNYGGEAAFGVWGAQWCASEADLGVDDVKDGERPELLDTFVAMTTWGYDTCDLTARSREQVLARAQQNHRLHEQVAAETEFAARLLADAPTPQVVSSLKYAIGYLEGQLAKTGTVGVIHAGAQWASQEFGLAVKAGTRLVSPLGHTWVFGGGYVDALDYTLVATSPLFGWRTDVAVQDAMQPKYGQYAAVAERSLVIGYEAVVAAATID